MRGFSKLGITLTSVFSLLLLALLAEILYLLWRRRQLLRLRRTRVEPAGAALPTTANHCQPLETPKLDAIDGPSSRVLFTIKEEDREELETEELPSAGERKTENVLAGESPEVVVVVDFEAEPPFLTPCASPPYCTPSSSPEERESRSPEIGELSRSARMF